jgi:Tfp pilus assembly protein PilW
MSLSEVLVAVTILALAMTTALVLYDAARQSFKKSENVIDQQQVVRIAFDMIASDLRMAGFNYNPDGSQVRPDEQIELAYDTAVVVRADFDAFDPAESGAPETLLAGDPFQTVSTGNDEIVGYVLKKPGAPTAAAATGTSSR